MNNLKTYAELNHKLNKLIEAVIEFSRDIGMEFRLGKCPKCTIRKRKKVRSESIQIAEDNFIKIDQ